MQWYSSLPKMLEKIIPQHIKLGTILEIGPGTLWPGLWLLAERKDLDLIACGYTESQKQAARQKAKQLGVLPRVTYYSGDGKNIPLPNRAVDGVISFGSLHAWKLPLQTLNEIARVLKLEGEIFIGDVCPEAGRFSCWLAARKNPEWQTLYRNWPKTLKTSDLKDLLAASQLENSLLQVMGPDIWIMRHTPS